MRGKIHEKKNKNKKTQSRRLKIGTLNSFIDEGPQQQGRTTHMI